MALALRPYQSRTVDAIGWSNAIVIMPTGSGKTFLAAEVIRRQLMREIGGACLFLVPTQDLVEQQAVAIDFWCPDDFSVLRFSGGREVPRTWEASEKVCLVSTPQAFCMLQNRNPSGFGWQKFRLVVFDEVHHVLKNHPYRHIALSLKRLRGHIIQILGLSASLTYQIRDSRITNDLNRLHYELQLQRMESPSLDELIDGGYIPPHGRNVELESTTEVPEGIIPLADRKPHEMHRQFMRRIRNNQATPTALMVWTVVCRLEDRIREFDSSFESPLTKAKLIRWEERAFKLAQGKSEPTKSLLGTLEYWYGSLRLLVQTWEEEELLALFWLKMNNAFVVVGAPIIAEMEELRVRTENHENFFKFGRLCHHLIEKRERFMGAFKCIIFVQQRITAVILSHFINHNQSELSNLGIKAGFVTSRDSVITPRIKVTRSQATATINAFRENEINVLVATSVIEEGFDVPSANVVISYNHLKDSVELCQRFGRARQQDSAIVLLEERPDRPLALLESVRARQEAAVREFDASSSQFDIEEEKRKQHDRERCACQSIFLRQRESTSPVQDINIFTKKTKASLTEDYEKVGSNFKCTFQYRSIIRTLVAEAEASSKKNAKKQCASLLLTMFKSQIRPLYL